MNIKMDSSLGGSSHPQKGTHSVFDPLPVIDLFAVREADSSVGRYPQSLGLSGSSSAVRSMSGGNGFEERGFWVQNQAPRRGGA